MNGEVDQVEVKNDSLPLDLIGRISLINCQTKSAMYFINKNELDNAKTFVDCIELNIKELREILQNENA